MAQKRVYRSMQGKVVDMELLAQKHELTPAIGNVRVNARGDELGPGGRIVRKREDIMAEYYENNPNAVPEEQFKRVPRPSEKQNAAETSSNVSPEPEHRASSTRKTNTARREVKNEDQSDS